MSIKMKAAKRFRLVEEQGPRWLNAGDTYAVETEVKADKHEIQGRGVRVADATKSAKKGV